VILLPSLDSSPPSQPNSQSKISAHSITSLVLKCFPHHPVYFSLNINIFMIFWSALAWTMLRRLEPLSLPRVPSFSMMVRLLPTPLSIRVSLGHCNTLILLAQICLSLSTSYLNSCTAFSNPTRLPLNVYCVI